MLLVSPKKMNMSFWFKKKTDLCTECVWKYHIVDAFAFWVSRATRRNSEIYNK
jgi:hypothetical protein